MTETRIWGLRRRFGHRTAMAAVLVAGALLLPMSAQAWPINSGGGTVAATVDSITPGIPAVFRVCEWNVTYTIKGTSALVFNHDTAASQFAGIVELNGTGSSDTSCESYSSGGGLITLSAHGVGAADPNSTFDCDNLVGRYVRILSNMELISTARHCYVNGIDAGQVTFLAELQFIPEGDGAGITASIKRASLTGTITVVTA